MLERVGLLVALRVVLCPWVGMVRWWGCGGCRSIASEVVGKGLGAVFTSACCWQAVAGACSWRLLEQRPGEVLTLVAATYHVAGFYVMSK